MAKGSNRIVVGATLAILAASYVALDRDRLPGDAEPAGADVARRSAGLLPHAEGVGGPVAAPIAARAGGRAFASLESGYRWNPVEPGIAENAEDAAWLSAHGYPGPDVERYLLSLSVDALRRLAGNGNQPAQAILAYRLALSGAPADDVVGLLERSAAEGSVYALKMAGDIFQTVPGLRDPEMAHAYYGLLTRRGDQGGLTANAVFGEQLSPDQRARSRLLEEVLWRGLLARRKRPFEQSMRPGFVLLVQHGASVRAEDW